MSYILDALKRAESERERGSIPGIYTQQMPPGASADAGNAPGSGLLWPAVGMSVALLGAVALYLYAPVTLRLTPTGLPPVPTGAALPAPQITTVTAVATTPRVVADDAQASEPLASTRVSRRTGAAEPGGSGAAERRAAARARASAVEEPLATVQAKTTEGRIYALNDLPENIRAELPKVVIGGSSYSTNPALRMLMINGKMFQEREQPEPNLQLEQIRQGSAVLKYKGYRYRVAF